MNHYKVDMSHHEVDMSHPEVDMSHHKVVMSQSHYEPLHWSVVTITAVASNQHLYCGIDEK